MADVKIQTVPPIAVIRRALKELGDVAATKEFKDAGYQAATNVVIPKAQSLAAGLGQMQARAADTLAAVRTVTGGAVRYGRGFPPAMGAEFGAMRDQMRGDVGPGPGLGYNQFLPWRGSGAGAGYAVYPAVRDNPSEIVAEFDKGLEPLYQRLGWK